MADTPTTRELQIMFDNLGKQISEKQGDFAEMLNEIRFDLKITKEQTLKTNGRVNNLEWWRSMLRWGVGALWAVVALLIIVGVPYFQEEQKQQSAQLQQQIQNSVNSSIIAVLKDYNITVQN